MKLKFILILLVLSMPILAGCGTKSTPLVSNFEDCVNAGYPVMESYPRQCSDGVNNYTEAIPN